MAVVKFTRHVARYRKAMKDRIEARIKQLKDEQEERRVQFIMVMSEIDGQVKALTDMIAALENERPADQEGAA